MPSYFTGEDEEAFERQERLRQEAQLEQENQHLILAEAIIQAVNSATFDKKFSVSVMILGIITHHANVIYLDIHTLTCSHTRSSLTHFARTLTRKI